LCGGGVVVVCSHHTTTFLLGYLGEVQERGEEVEVEEKQKLDGLTHRREQRDHAGLFLKPTHQKSINQQTKAINRNKN
jgi:hypothetical protein